MGGDIVPGQNGVEGREVDGRDAHTNFDGLSDVMSGRADGQPEVVVRSLTSGHL